MMMAPKGSRHTLMIRKNLRNAHIINKSYIANAFSNAFALRGCSLHLPKKLNGVMMRPSYGTFCKQPTSLRF